MRIRDPGWKKFGSGIRDEKYSDPESGINIPDPQHYVHHLVIVTVQLRLFLISID